MNHYVILCKTNNLSRLKIGQRLRKKMPVLLSLILGLILGYKIISDYPSVNDYNAIIRLTLQNSVRRKNFDTIYVNISKKGEYKAPKINGKNIHFINEQELEMKIEQDETFLYYKLDIRFQNMYKSSNKYFVYRYRDGNMIKKESNHTYYERKPLGKWETISIIY